jgi:Leucine-rich repeat (LRR) protein
VFQKIDDILDYKILNSNAEKATILQNIDDSRIKSLKGIEAFTNLTFLSYSTTFNNENITSLDLTLNKKLKTIAISTLKNLQNLNITNLTEVEWLDISSTKLSVVPNLSKLTKLNRLYCNNMSISSIDISNNISLQYLGLSFDKLTSINVTKNINLIDFHSKGNLFQTLDFSKNTKLSSVDVRNNANLKSICTYHLGLAASWEYDSNVQLKECK